MSENIDAVRGQIAEQVSVHGPGRRPHALAQACTTDTLGLPGGVPVEVGQGRVVAVVGVVVIGHDDTKLIAVNLQTQQRVERRKEEEKENKKERKKERKKGEERNIE